MSSIFDKCRITRNVPLRNDQIVHYFKFNFNVNAQLNLNESITIRNYSMWNRFHAFNFYLNHFGRFYWHFTVRKIWKLIFFSMEIEAKWKVQLHDFVVLVKFCIFSHFVRIFFYFSFGFFWLMCTKRIQMLCLVEGWSQFFFYKFLSFSLHEI